MAQKALFGWQKPKSGTVLERLLIERFTAAIEKYDNVFDLADFMCRYAEWDSNVGKGMEAVSERLSNDLAMLEKAKPSQEPLG